MDNNPERYVVRVVIEGGHTHMVIDLDTGDTVAIGSLTLCESIARAANNTAED